MVRCIYNYSVLIVFFLFFISCEEVFFETDISEDQVIILSPSNKAEIEGTDVSLYWEPLEGAASYRLEIARGDFESGNYIYSEEVEEHSVDIELPLGDYEWRVRGLNSQYISLAQTFQFTLIDITEFSNRKVKILSPDDDVVSNNGKSIRLLWNSVEEANLYRIQIERDGSLENEYTTQDTIYSIDFNEGLSIIKIRAENEAQHTIYSLRNYILDNTAPATPVLVLPEDNQSISNTEEVKFSWKPDFEESEDTASEYDSIYLFFDEGLERLFAKEEITHSNEINYEVKTDSSYYWFVRRFDRAGNASDSSQVRMFRMN